MEERQMRRICSDDELGNFFRDGKPHRVEELKNRFGISVAVVYRELKRLGAVPALNMPGFYALPGTRRCDRDGLFRIDDAVFFSGGNLPGALISIVSKSSSGITVRELEKKVKTTSKVQLFSLVRGGRLKRRKFKGEYYYFSADEETGKRQLEECEKRFNNYSQDQLLEQLKNVPLMTVVMVLVTHIKHPGFNAKSIALSLTRRGTSVTTEKVKAVFEKYDLAKKNS